MIYAIKTKDHSNCTHHTVSSFDFFLLRSDNMLTKSFSCNEISSKPLPPELYASQMPSNKGNANFPLIASKRHKSNDKLTKSNKTESHKTVIYFGDSLSNKKKVNQLQHQMKSTSHLPSSSSILSGESSDIRHAKRLCDEMVFQRQKSGANRKETKRQVEDTIIVSSDVKMVKNDQPKNLVKQLKTALEEKCQPKTNLTPARKPIEGDKVLSQANTCGGNVRRENLPSFVESVADGVINIKIDGSYDAATRLVRSIENTDDDDFYDGIDDNNNHDFFFDVGGEMNNIYFDWSFVQDWRSR